MLGNARRSIPVARCGQTTQAGHGKPSIGMPPLLSVSAILGRPRACHTIWPAVIGIVVAQDVTLHTRRWIIVRCDQESALIGEHFSHRNRSSPLRRNLSFCTKNVSPFRTIGNVSFHSGLLRRIPRSVRFE